MIRCIALACSLVVSGHDPVTVTTPELYVVPPIAVTIRSAAMIFGADADTMMRVAACESRLDPDAVGDDGAAVGLFQFHESTFIANAARAGLPYVLDGDRDDRFSPAASAMVAAYMFSAGHADRWTCK